MLLVNRMAGSAQGVLEVPQHGVDPLEALQFHAFAASASDHGSVPAACVNHAGETAQSVGDDLAAPGDTLSNVAGDFGLAEAPDTAELHPNRLLITRLHRCQEGDLVLRAATPFSRAFAAQMGVVELDASGELLLALPLQHDLKQFMPDFPGRVMVDTDFPGQLQRRDALLAPGQKTDGEEPLGQRQSCSMENRSSGD